MLLPQSHSWIRPIDYHGGGRDCRLWQPFLFSVQKNLPLPSGKMPLTKAPRLLSLMADWFRRILYVNCDVRTDPYPQKIPAWLYGHVFLLIGKQGFIGQNLPKATMDLLLEGFGHAPVCPPLTGMI